MTGWLHSVCVYVTVTAAHSVAQPG